MKIAFMSELGVAGKVMRGEPNLRTEFAWMVALDADHYNLIRDPLPQGYDLVIVIIPKGEVFLNAVGVRMDKNASNPSSQLLHSNLISDLKEKNIKVGYVQEGPNWLFNDYNIEDQFGNFARWYGGFQSFVIANEFDNEIWCQESHAKQPNEDNVEGLNHYSRLSWIDWVHEISRFKYAVHLMPTVAAGTFSLNCAYWGIPCIGNSIVDTQNICFPDLSVHIDDTESARKSCIYLKDVKKYKEVSEKARSQFDEFYSEQAWKKYFYEQI